MPRPSEPFHVRFLMLLLPGLLQGGLGILVLPLTTLILTAEDYGAFALVAAFASAVGALAALGSSFTLTHRFVPAVTRESCTLVSTVLLVVCGASVLSALLLLGGFILAREHTDLAAAISPLGVALSLIEMIGGCLWGIATSIAVLSRTTRLHASLSSARALATPASVLAALFVFDVQGPMALFLGAAAGGLVMLAGTIAISRPYLRFSFDRQIALDSVRVGGWMGLANFAEMLQRLVERWALAAFVGLRATGLLNHAQVYPNMLMMGIRPAVQSAWPAFCEEARAERLDFKRGRYLSHLIGAAVSTAAIALALVGLEFIGLLTNGQFSESAPYAAILTATVGLRMGGRAQYAVIVANGHAAAASVVNGLAAIATIALTVLLIPLLGILGAVFALVGYAAIFLALLHYYSRQIRHAPFLDASAVVGFLATVAVVSWVHFYSPSLGFRLALLAIVLAGGMTIGIGIVRASGLLGAGRTGRN